MRRPGRVAARPETRQLDRSRRRSARERRAYPAQTDATREQGTQTGRDLALVHDQRIALGALEAHAHQRGRPDRCFGRDEEAAARGSRIVAGTRAGRRRVRTRRAVDAAESGGARVPVRIAHRSDPPGPSVSRTGTTKVTTRTRSRAGKRHADRSRLLSARRARRPRARSAFRPSPRLRCRIAPRTTRRSARVVQPSRRLRLCSLDLSRSPRSSLLARARQSSSARFPTRPDAIFDSSRVAPPLRELPARLKLRLSQWGMRAACNSERTPS